MSKILMVASEATPFAKTGGLADVIGSLPAALKEFGDDVAVLLPKYGGVVLPDATRVYDRLAIWLGNRRYDTAIHLVSHQGVPFYFLDCPELYDRDGLYGTPEG